MRVKDIEPQSFLPRELNGMANRLNVKRNAEKMVESFQRRDANYVREHYLCKVRLLYSRGPVYLHKILGTVYHPTQTLTLFCHVWDFSFFVIKRGVSQYVMFRKTWYDDASCLFNLVYIWFLQVEESQCAYGREEYVLERAEGTSINTVRLSVNPFHVEHPGLRYALPARRPVS